MNPPSNSVATPGPAPAAVDLRQCKAAFAKLSPTHPLRIAFEGEKDFMPYPEAVAKFGVWLRLCYAV